MYGRVHRLALLLFSSQYKVIIQQLVRYKQTDNGRHQTHRTYLEANALPECDITRHSEVVQLEHVWDALKPLQELLYLHVQTNSHLNKSSFWCKYITS